MRTLEAFVVGSAMLFTQQHMKRVAVTEPQSAVQTLNADLSVFHCLCVSG
jgi:hypothetical protein